MCRRGAATIHWCIGICSTISSAQGGAGISQGICKPVWDAGQPASLQVISREDGSCYVGELLASWKAAVEEVNGFLQLVDIEDRQPVGWPEVYLSLSGRPATESRIPFKYLNSDEQRLRILRAREAMQSIATEKMGSLAQLQFRVDLQTGEKRFVAVPISLLGAIWVLAFRYACNYRPQTQTCSACGRPTHPYVLQEKVPRTAQMLVE